MVLIANHEKAANVESIRNLGMRPYLARSALVEIGMLDQRFLSSFANAVCDGDKDNGKAAEVCQEEKAKFKCRLHGVSYIPSGTAMQSSWMLLELLGDEGCNIAIRSESDDWVALKLRRIVVSAL